MGLWDWTGKNVWDLGSHYGLYAIGLGRRVGPAGSVAAFEPNPLSFERLQLHMRRNPMDWVKAFPYAVSDIAADQRLFAYAGLESTTTHLAYEGETWDASIPTVSVPTRRLDDLVAAGEIRHPDFVKVDVEGHGHHALAGAAKTLATALPTLVCAFHSDQELRGIRAVLDPLGYSYFPVLPEAPGTPKSGFEYIARHSAGGPAL